MAGIASQGYKTATQCSAGVQGAGAQGSAQHTLISEVPPPVAGGLLLPPVQGTDVRLQVRVCVCLRAFAFCDVSNCTKWLQQHLFDVVLLCWCLLHGHNIHSRSMLALTHCALRTQTRSPCTPCPPQTPLCTKHPSCLPPVPRLPCRLSSLRPLSTTAAAPPLTPTLTPPQQ